MAEKSKKKFKLNIFDIVIIVVIICVVAVLFMLTQKKEVSPTKTITYTIELNDKAIGFTNNIEAGDSLVESTKNYNMGNVVSATAVPYQKLITDYENKSIVETAVPERETAVIKVSANITESDSMLFAGGSFPVKVGKEIFVRGPGYAGEGFIIGIERDGE